MLQLADQLAAAFTTVEFAGQWQPVFFRLDMVIFPFLRDDLLNLLPLLKRDELLTGNLDIFNQFALTVILIAAVNRLFCYGVNGTFIEKNVFPPAFVAITDDGTVRTVGADIIVDETDDFNPFGNHLDFSVAEIANPMHLGIAAKFAAVFLDPERVDAVLTFLL